MSSYRATRGISWDPQRHLADWVRFENLVILVDDEFVGLLQLLMVDGALEVRDLQVLPAHRRRGLGAWVVGRVESMARARGIGALRLRVYEENPARHLYTRLGFKIESIDGGTLHMSYAVLPGQPATDGAEKRHE